MSALSSITSPVGFRQTLASGLLLVGITATVGGALAFQHIGGYMPCALCLEQRTPYYASIPIAAVALALCVWRAPALLTRLLLVAIGAIMLWSVWLGAFHAGVEWGFWAGPADCAAGGPVDLSGDLLAAIDAVTPPSCSEAALRILGLSLAGWNAILSAIFAAIALRAAASPADRFARHG